MAENTLHSQSGNKWVAKTYKISGGWAVNEINGENFFILEEDFKTNSGPDLKLYLTKSKIVDISNRESVDKTGVCVAELLSNLGKQRYKIPEGTNLSEYESIVIHCKAYSVVWGGVEL